MAERPADGFEVKGITLRGRLDFIAAVHGVDAVERVLGALPPTQASVLRRSILATRWYPRVLLQALDDAICGLLLGDRSPAAYRRLGAEQCAYQRRQGQELTGSSPHLAMKGLEAAYRSIHRPGQASYRPLGHLGAEIVVTGVPCVPTQCQVNAGFLQELLGQLGVLDVAVQTPRCGIGSTRCVYEVHWRLAPGRRG